MREGTLLVPQVFRF